MFKLLFFLSFLLSPLMAGNSGEIIIFGYFDFVKGALEAIAGLVATAGADSYVKKIIYAFALIITLIRASTNPQGNSFSMTFDFVKLVTIITLVNSLFLEAPDDDNHAYLLVDRITNQSAEIRQIPKGLGETLKLFTNIEDKITEEIETFFSTPNSITYRNAGLGFPIIGANKVLTSQIYNPYFSKTLKDYMENCKYLGDFKDGTQTVSDLFIVDDLKSFLATNQDLTTTVYEDNNEHEETCKDAWDNYIEPNIDSFIDDIKKEIATSLGMTSSVLSDKLDTVFSNRFNSAHDTQKQIENAILRNTILSTIQSTSASLGLSQAQLVRYKSLAEIQMTQDGFLSNLMAGEYIPLMKALVFVFTIALTWFMAIFTIITLDLRFIRFIITMNMWLVMWSPLFTILNFAIDTLITSELANYGEITISNQQAIFMLLGAKLGFLQKLTWSIPVLAYAVIKGSDHAMVSFIGNMTSGVAGAGSSAVSSGMADAKSGDIARKELGNNYSVARQQRVSEMGAEVTTANNGITEAITGQNFSVSDYTSGITAGHNQGVFAADFSKVLNLSSTTAINSSISKSLDTIKSITQGMTKGEAFNVIKSISTLSSQNDTASLSKNYGVSENNAKIVSSTYSEAKKSALSKITKKTKSEAYKDLIQAGIDVKSGDFIPFINANGSVTIQGAKGQTYTFDSSSAFAKEFTKTTQENLAKTLSENQSKAETFQEVLQKASQKNDSFTYQGSGNISTAFSELQSFKDIKSFAETNGVNAVVNLQNQAILRKAMSRASFAGEEYSKLTEEQKQKVDREAVKIGDEILQDPSKAKDIVDMMLHEGRAEKIRTTFDKEKEETIKTINAEKQKISNDINSNKEAYKEQDTKQEQKKVESRIEDTKNRLKQKTDNLPNGDNIKNEVNKDLKGQNVKEEVNNNIKKAEDKITKRVDKEISKKNFSETVSQFSNELLEQEKKIIKDRAKEIGEFISSSKHNKETVDKLSTYYDKAVESGLVEKSLLGIGGDKINTDMLQKATTQELENILKYNNARDNLPLMNDEITALDSKSAQLIEKELEKREYQQPPQSPQSPQPPQSPQQPQEQKTMRDIAPTVEKLHSLGYDNNEIAKMLNVSTGKVENVLQSQQTNNSGITTNEVTNALQSPQQPQEQKTMRDIAPTVEKLHSLGYDNNEIAKMLNVSTGKVENVFLLEQLLQSQQTNNRGTTTNENGGDAYYVIKNR